MSRSFLFLVIVTLQIPTSAPAQWDVAGGPEYKAGDILSLLMDADTLYAGSSAGGTYRSTDNGTHWQQVNAGQPYMRVNALLRSSVDGAGEVDFYAGTFVGLFKSTDRCRSWTERGEGLTTPYIHSLAADPLSQGRILFAGTFGGGVFRSIDSGAHWSGASDGLGNLNVRSLAAYAGGGERWLYAGTEEGLFCSTDAGSFWIPAGGGPAGKTVLSICAILRPGGFDLFAGTQGGGMFRSTDFGASWSPCNNGLKNPTIRAMMLIPLQAVNALFASTNDGVYFTTDNGEKWIFAGTGLAGKYVLSLAWGLAGNSPGGLYLFAGLRDGYGVWRRRLEEVLSGVPEPDARAAAAFELMPVSPNPFTSSAVIRFSLPVRCRVTLEIADLFGTRIAQLLSEEREAGNHAVIWSGRNTPAGAYLCLLRAGGVASSRTILLLR